MCYYSIKFFRNDAMPLKFLKGHVIPANHVMDGLYYTLECIDISSHCEEEQF